MRRKIAQKDRQHNNSKNNRHTRSNLEYANCTARIIGKISTKCIEQNNFRSCLDDSFITKISI